MGIAILPQAELIDLIETVSPDLAPEQAEFLADKLGRTIRRKLLRFGSARQRLCGGNWSSKSTTLRSSGYSAKPGWKLPS